jgi:hypothetical protein
MPGRATFYTSKRQLFVAGTLMALLLALLSLNFGMQKWRQVGSAPPTQPDAPDLPLVFVPNIGQANDETSFLAHTSAGALSFTHAGVSLQLPIENQINSAPEDETYTALSLVFLNPSTTATIEGADTLPGKVNYFVGNDPSKWRTGVESYGSITYRGIYPGIDLKYEGGVAEASEGAPLLKGTYHVAPGADPSLIAWRYDGAKSVTLDGAGNLQIGMEGIALTELAPVAWQEVNGQRTPVDARYSLASDGAITFALGSYDPGMPLIIDPFLTYSTYLGGNFAETGRSIVVDPMGNFYVTGYTNSSNFPTVNAFQSNFGGGALDAFVAKFNPQGQPVYLTYLGGTSSDEGFGIATDPDGNAYVVGYTASQNFPLANAYQATYGGGFHDVFVTKLNPTGSALIFSTFLGGSDDDQGGDISLDGARNIYLTGSTSSNNFPVRNAIQPTRLGNSFDLFITKFNPAASDLVWSTYLGGTSSDTGSAIAVDSTGNTFVVGASYSADYPTLNAFQSTLRGTRDGILSKINAAGSALVYSTYIGGGADDFAQGVDVDGTGNAYVAGYTDSATFPIINAYQSSLRGLSDAFVAKFTPTGGAIYATYFGGEWLDHAGDIAVNANEEAFIVGSTQSDELPLASPLYSQLRGSEDVFITRFNRAGSGLLFSTYFGGTDNREMQQGGGAIAIDSSNSIYFTGDTGSSDFPTYNPYQPFRGSAVDSFVSRISENSATPTPTATGSPQPSPTACIVGDYTITQGTGTLVPGTTFLPNSACDNCTAPIAFPFPIKFYDQTFTQGRVGSEGTLQFTSDNALQANFCLPYGGHNNTIFAFWDDLYIGDQGVRTSVTGTAPNRVLNIEWRGELSSNFEPVNFEIRLFENGQQFEIIYAQTGGESGDSATIGVQRDTGSRYTQFSCNQPLVTPGTKLTFTLGSCLTPTPATPGTPSATPTATTTPPALLYSTYFSSFERDILEDVARDAAGNIYVMGTTFQNDIDYGDLWLAKFSPDGQQLIYQRIVGGTRIDYGYALAVDAAGNATIAGIATSFDYPLLNPIQSQHNLGIYDVVMTKFNPQGTMIFSTYLGGNGVDYAERLQTDALGNIYLTGRTDSSNWPTTAGAFQQAHRGRDDGYVTKISPNGSSILWSTYLGGLFADTANDLALDAQGNVYIIGHTVSPDFPTLNPFQADLADSSGDVFVTKMNPQGTGILYSTFLGGSFPPGPGEDNGQGITVDAAGHAYVTGFTESPDFPTTPGSFQQFFKGYKDAFVTKFTPAGNALVYSTFLGGTLNSPYGEDIAYDIALDGAGQAHVTGKTYSPDFPIVNAVQPIPGDVYDAFITKFNASGSALIYSTFLGGRIQPPSFTGNDVGLGILIDASGNAVIAGGTASFNFPVVNPYQAQSEGPGDGFIAKISGSNPVVTPTPGQATSTSTPTVAASPTPCNIIHPLVEGFEGGNLGAFAATSIPDEMPGWRATNGASHTGQWSAYSPSTYTAGDQRLTTTSPAMIPASVTQAGLSFWHRYLLEPGDEGDCIDGGVMELSTDGGANWLDVEDYFLSGGYNGTIIGWQNPLEGRRGWCGQSVIFSEVRLNLASFAGQSLLFRFRQGTDTFIAHDGWWIDDVSVTYTATACPTVIATATVQTTSTAIPTGTRTPVGTPQASATAPSAGTAIATGTPVQCTLSFIDVPTNNTFYANIKCLACRGIISGYSDGTFRPNNDITRGQIAKVVSNAAGFNENPGNQIYEDVPPTNTFYAWINRLSMRGHMGGYPCGIVPTEPCGTPSRPYFRPDASATRGQLAKIVASAAHITGTPTGQRYADVEPDSTFYVWIEQLSTLGVMGGYPCGGSGETCGPDNKPYFRPNNNVTRGQASKIVANTFFPGCQTP